MWNQQPEIIGWRVWTAIGDTLVSPAFHPVKWPYDEPLVAHCNYHEDHIPPARDCMCGIWATRYMPPTIFQQVPSGQDTRRPFILVNRIHVQPLILGLVRLWGQVAIHGDEGWRGQHARPVALFWGYQDEVNIGCLTVTIQHIARNYGIPCINLYKPLWPAAAKELGAPSTKWLDPILHKPLTPDDPNFDCGNQHVNRHLIRCNCGFERNYTMSLSRLRLERPWTLDWIQHWAELERTSC